MINTEKIFGIIPYLVSPTDNHGNINTIELHKLCKWLKEKGVHGVAALGSTGEFAYLSWEDRFLVAKTVIEAVGDNLPVLLGVSASTVREAVRQSKEMENLGCHGINLAIDTYTEVSFEGVVEYYKEVASSVSVPIVVYINKSLSNYSLEALFAKLSTLENIKYIKDATGNTGQLLTLINNYSNELTVFSASAHVPLSVFLLGGGGWMAGPACLLPSASLALYQLAQRGEWEKATKLQKKIWAVNNLFLKYDPAAVIKYGLNHLAFNVGDPLCPGSKLPDDATKELLSVIDTIREEEKG